MCWIWDGYTRAYTLHQYRLDASNVLVFWWQLASLRRLVQNTFLLHWLQLFLNTMIEQLDSTTSWPGPQDYRPDPQRGRAGGAQGAHESAASPHLQEGDGRWSWWQDGWKRNRGAWGLSHPGPRWSSPRWGLEYSPYIQETHWPLSPYENH